MPGTALTEARIRALKPRKTAYDRRFRLMRPSIMALS